MDSIRRPPEFVAQAPGESEPWRPCLKDLDRLVDPATSGDPESSLRCTCKNVRQLAEELQQEGHALSYQTVAELLHSLQFASQPEDLGGKSADQDRV